jgi:hypothetical protein
MATITGLTAARMLEIEAASVVDGDIVGDDLILARQDGSIINAGNVRGTLGPAGPMGSSLSVLNSRLLSEVGLVNQIRAGRPLTPADFTNQGLSAPAGLWTLANFSDSSGNARTLTNKGSIALTEGIQGVASTAALFVGSSAQLLYIPDTGAADSLRIRNGSFGQWMRSSRRGVVQTLMSKYIDAVAGQRGWLISVSASNVANLTASSDGTAAAGSLVSAAGTSDIADDRWHFVVATVDGGKLRLYVDGVQEAVVLGMNLETLNPTAAAFNIGGYGGDAVTAPTSPLTGRVAQAFVTPDVLSLEQIRYLMAASIPHALAAVPADIRVSVRRRRRGAPLATTDFPAQPLRLHNFVGGALTDQGSQNIPLALSTGTSVDGAAPDGSASGSKNHISTTNLRSSDAGLPSGLAARSFGVWFKTVVAANMQMISWGGAVQAIIRTNVSAALGSDSGADLMGFATVVNDGLWHHAAVVEDNSAVDGLKRKLYLDGKLNAVSTVMNSIVLAGASGFGVGGGWQGSVSRPFVYGGALTADQVKALYNVSSQALAPKPKDESDFVEAVELARILAIFNGIEGTDSVDLTVMA